MNTLRSIIKDCKIEFHEISSKLRSAKNSVNSGSDKIPDFAAYGIQVVFPQLIFTAHPTYMYDIIDVQIDFRSGEIPELATDFANILSKEFNVIQSPTLKLKTSLFDEGKKPENITMLLKCDDRYRMMVLIMLLFKFPNFCDDENIV